MPRVALVLALVAAAVGAASAAAVGHGAIDPTSLPLGDGKYTTSGPKKGFVYSCGPHNGGGRAQ